MTRTYADGIEDAARVVALKPCPFCGAEAEIIERNNPMSKWRFSVDCGSTTCGMSGPVEASTRAASTAWNARTLSPSPSGDDAREADWVDAAAGYTIDGADTPLPCRMADGTGVEHAAWMLTEILDGRITGRKAHRWLGYAQGLLVAADWLTLEDAKLANKRASDELATLCESASSKIGGDHG